MHVKDVCHIYIKYILYVYITYTFDIYKAKECYEPRTETNAPFLVPTSAI